MSYVPYMTMTCEQFAKTEADAKNETKQIVTRSGKVCGLQTEEPPTAATCKNLAKGSLDVKVKGSPVAVTRKTPAKGPHDVKVEGSRAAVTPKMPARGSLDVNVEGSPAAVTPKMPARGSPAVKSENASVACKPENVSPMLRVGKHIVLDRKQFKILEWVLGTMDKHTQLYTGIDDKGVSVMLKAQLRHKKTVLQVTTEYNTLTDIWRKNLKGLCIQDPRAYACHDSSCYVLVTNMEGPDLNTLASSDGTHTSKNVLAVAAQVLDQIQKVHDVGYIHRDVKPENIVRAGHDSRRLCLIDFGTAESRLDRNGEPKKKPQAAEGTYQFMSVWVQQKQPMGKRDDIESVLWTLLKLSLGMLPWDEDQPAAMLEKKKAFNSPKNLDVSMTAFFEGFVQHVRALVKFDDDPDYALLHNLVQTAWEGLGYPGKVRDACLEY